MNQIDKNFYSFFAILACFGLAYLLGSFVAASTDITKWDAVGRFFVVVVGVVSAVTSVGGIQSIKK
jgi:uncharacterized membrane protein HdeD (DUF308 family)